MIKCRRIILDGLSNLRDLGGFMTEEFKVTKYGRFMRSEEPTMLTFSDIELLKKFNIRNCIDLRSYKQIHDKPSTFENQNGLAYYIIDTDLKEIQLTEKKMYRYDFTEAQWSDILFELFEQQKVWFGKAIKIIAKTEDGVLFNCYSGRNRSNLLAFILLKIAKVPDVDIIAEYSTNEIYLTDKYSILYDMELYSKDFFKTPGWAFKEFINTFNSEYESIEAYLLKCDVSENEIKKIYDSFVESL